MRLPDVVSASYAIWATGYFSDIHIVRCSLASACLDELGLVSPMLLSGLFILLIVKDPFRIAEGGCLCVLNLFDVPLSVSHR